MTAATPDRPAPPPRFQRAARWIDALVLTLLVALLAFGPFAFGMVDAWSELIGMGCTAAIAVALAVRFFLHPSDGGIRQAALVPVIMFVLIALIQLVPSPASVIRAAAPETAAMKSRLLSDLPQSSQPLTRISVSFDPNATRHDLRIVLMAAVVFTAVLISARSEQAIRRVLAAIALIAGVMAILALSQDISRSDAIYWRVHTDRPAVSGTFFNHSHFGQFMNLSIGAALALLLLRLQEGVLARNVAAAWRRSAWLVIIILIGVATVTISLTRGGMLAMAGAAALLVFSLLRRQLGGTGLAVAGLIVAGGLIAMYFAAETVAGRIESLGQTQHYQERLLMARDALRLWQEFPLLGSGLGTFEYVFPQFDTSPGLSVASHAENEYVQAAAETGVIGLGAVVIFVVIIWRSFARCLRPDRMPTGIAAIGLGYALLAVMIHSFSDFGQHVPAIACLSAAICGMMINLAGIGRSVRAGGRGMGLIAAAVLLAACAWSLGGALHARHAESESKRAASLARRLERRDWQGTDLQYGNLLVAAGAAADAEPDNVYYRYWLDVYRWRSITRASGGVSPTPQTLGYVQHIVADLNDARRLCPTYAAIYYFVGQIESFTLHNAIGVKHLRTAYTLAPNDPEICRKLAIVEARRGEWDRAEQLFRKSMSIRWESLFDVINFYIHDVKRPDLLIHVARADYGSMLHVANHLFAEKLPEWGEQARREGADLLAERAADPDAPAPLLLLAADHQLGQQRYTLAADLFARGFALSSPPDAVARAHYAVCLAKLGKTADAIDQAHRSLRIQPDQPQALQVLKDLGQN